MVSICGLQCADSVVIILFFEIYLFSLAQTMSWPHWKCQQQNVSLRCKSQNQKALSALDASPTDSLSIAAKTLTDSYYSKLSVVSVRQEPNILNLAHILSGPKFATIENDIMSASARMAGRTIPRAQVESIGHRGREQPPEDEDDDDVDDEEDDEKKANSSQSLHLFSNDKSANELQLRTGFSADPPTTERSLDVVTSKVISMSKVVLRAAKLLLGFSFDVFGRAMSSPVKKTIAKVVRERKLSSCSKTSLATVVREGEKLEILIKLDKCNVGAVLEHSLTNLKVSLNILKCYMSLTSSGDQSSEEEMSGLDEQILDLSRTMIVLEKTYQKSFFKGHSDQFLTELIRTQISELQDKFDEILTTDLILRLSIYDSFMQTFTINIQQMMREFSEGIAAYLSQLTIAAIEADDAANNAIVKEYCIATLDSGMLLSNDIRSLGTTTVDKLIGAAKNIINSFEGITNRLSQGLDQLNSYRDMYDQLFKVVKNLKPELSEQLKE